ncbi:sorting nexin-10B isoform X3 [Polypterus senegalus]|uniref:sorting nexin-10B isoform X3 n=1 Tax=Polypterus senegalus TaxID=55291 RepID=UPI0019666DE2|nr:sorting nexin-10B isoform X3 [Polypterus senegalus]
MSWHRKMEDIFKKKEFVSVWVRDPRVQKEDSWHSFIDYEICLHTNSMCFRKKTTCVRRRYKEFVWLRQRLQDNALLIELPDLPPKKPFFSLSNKQQLEERIKGLQQFLEKILQNTSLLSDSRLHLFLQSPLSPKNIEACASGQTKYSVADAIQRYACSSRRFPVETEYEEQSKTYSDSDSESSSSGLGHSSDDNTFQDCKTKLSERETV